MKHVVIVGNGMAGHRVATRVHAARPEWDVTVVGAEPHAAYNRVLLTNLLAGRPDAERLTLPWPDGLPAPLTGHRATAIDRAARAVVLADGRELRWDRLVLATGANPVLPPVKGLVSDDGHLHPDAVAFRTLDDCRRIADLASRRRRAIVLGGGLLGLEAARGLAARGLEVHVVHAMGHLMERQLDPGAGAALAGALAELGVTCWTGAQAARVLGGGRMRGLVLTDGRHVPGDFLVVSCGARPDTQLAAAAGLTTARGVVVDDHLRTSAPDVYAVGDCAEHRGVAHGLVEPAWEQARIAAEALTDGDPGPGYPGSPPLTRLKAEGLDLAAMGDVEAEEAHPDAEVLHFSHSGRHVYQRIVVREERVVGAVLLGDATPAGPLSRLYLTGARIPLDRRLLLFPGLAAGAQDTEPADAVVCRCAHVTAEAIRRSRSEGARDAADVARRTHATTGCGGCRSAVERLLTEG
ncbi:FAD-dependent oxidoreductase [Streptomyces chumphonensis]|uniref:FAD-dependent oxidoreductase n=1 Tax=Streptomyces chumphonensis TaxID=1214925 RepID=UPI003D75C227